MRTDAAGREVYPEQELDPEELANHYDRIGYDWRRPAWITAAAYIARERDKA